MLWAIGLLTIRTLEKNSRDIFLLTVEKRIEWQQVNSGFDLYEPKSGACKLKISMSYFNYSVDTTRQRR